LCEGNAGFIDGAPLGSRDMEMRPSAFVITGSKHIIPKVEARTAVYIIPLEACIKSHSVRIGSTKDNPEFGFLSLIMDSHKFSGFASASDPFDKFWIDFAFYTQFLVNLAEHSHRA
jgi:hypothetical protein